MLSMVKVSIKTHVLGFRRANLTHKSFGKDSVGN